MIDTAKLKELIALMAEHDLCEVNIKQGEDTINLKRGANPATVINHQPVIYQGGGAPMMAAPMAMPQMQGQMAPMAAPQMQAPAAQAGPASGGSSSSGAAAAAAGLPTIDSPMVGTCYLAPNPDSPTFVKVGQRVTPDTVVCLIEAMKVFNEIKAEKAGVIEQVLVKNGEAVEFGQKIFAIKPA